MNKELQSYGWSSRWEKLIQSTDTSQLEPGRIGEVYREKSTVFTARGKEWGQYTGKLLQSVNSGESEAAVTGDWVLLRRVQGSDFLLITHVLDRKNVFRRQEAGQRTRIQNLAANLDTLFICSGLDGDFNLKRIDRYLLTAWESGIEPVILLTKADLAEDSGQQVAETRAHCPGTDVYALSAMADQGLEQLEPLLQKGHSIAMVGSSGCGKSTLLNRLMGEDVQTTREVREDDSRGRHTTTTRSMHILPSGAILIDTPGMREIQLWDIGESEELNPWADIEELKENCRFNDCSHRHEPGCAVKAAVEQGELEESRYQEYLQFLSEIGMTRAKRMEQRQKAGKQIAQFSRQLKKEGYKR